MVRLSVNWDGRTGGIKEQQLGFSDWERSAVRKQTRKEKFLCEMEAVLPFSTLVKMMQPFYPQGGPQGGRPPYGLETMLRIHLMQNWWSLTDDAMEDALIDTGAIRRFAGIDLAKDNIPDTTTILAFRHVVEQHHLAKEIFKTVEQYLEEKVLLLREGTVVDATIIHAPSHLHKE